LLSPSEKISKRPRLDAITTLPGCGFVPLMQKNHNNLAGRTTAEPTLATVDVEPEFVDSHGLQAIFGIKRTLAYDLLSTGHIRSVSLRRPGHTRGKRLFLVKSVREFLNGQLQATEKATDGKA
jgi:hypothetical protein